MLLATVAPTTRRVRVYSCARGSLVRTRLLDKTFNRVPMPEEIEVLRKQPMEFLKSIEDEAA